MSEPQAVIPDWVVSLVGRLTLQLEATRVIPPSSPRLSPEEQAKHPVDSVESTGDETAS